MEMEKKVAAEEETVREGVITLGTPYIFEGEEYREIDLSAMKKLTIKDAVDAQRELFNEQEVAASVLCETTTAFARKLAIKATGMPIEFFKLAPRRLSRKITATVHQLMSVDNTKVSNHVMQFDEPYQFKGKTYTEVDLNGIGDLTSMHESEAENRIVRAGFMITENSLNILHACVLASMATNLPEDFFLGLPVGETMKIRTAVNDAGFFE